MSTLEDILREHNIPFRIGGEHHHVRSGWIGVDCPYCGTRDKWHLGISRTGNFASCWKCGRHTLVDTLQHLGIPFPAARRLATGYRQGPTSPIPALGKLVIPPGLGPLQRSHRAYLEGRGFDPDQLIKLWQIQGFGVAGSYSWRIWVPVHYHGEVVSWTTRAIGDDVHLRYVNAKPSQEKQSPKRLLYGMDYARSTIIICEGPTDVWRLGPGAVATMGLQYTQSQVALMAQYARRYICFDSSPDAQARSHTLAEQLSLLPGVTHELELDADDPGSANAKEVALVRRTVFGAE